MSRRCFACFATILVVAAISCHGSQFTVLNGLECKVLSITRASEWTDPRFANFGNPALGFKDVPRVKAGAGYEFAIVKIGVKRRRPTARIPLKQIWGYDNASNRYKCPVIGQDDLGEKDQETREFAFAVPIGTQLSKLELSPAIFLELK